MREDTVRVRTWIADTAHQIQWFEDQICVKMYDVQNNGTVPTLMSLLERTREKFFFLPAFQIKWES